MVQQKIKDLHVRSDLVAFRTWMGASGDDFRRKPKKERARMWQEFQRQRWGFTHYIGDDCSPDGHAEHLLCWLGGQISDAEYFQLFRQEVAA
jgi:hypothetical protein